MRIPDGYVPRKFNVVFVTSKLRGGEWVSLNDLLDVGEHANEVRLIVDVLHYAGVIRSKSTAKDELLYQWIGG